MQVIDFPVERCIKWRETEACESTCVVVLVFSSFASLRPYYIFTFNLYVSSNVDGFGFRHFVLPLFYGNKQLLESNELIP